MTTKERLLSLLESQQGSFCSGAELAHKLQVSRAAVWKAVNALRQEGFAIDAVTTMNKRQLRQTLSGMKQANIAVRNFPLSVAELRKRLKLNDGGDTYIFATTTSEGDHILMLTHKTKK